MLNDDLDEDPAARRERNFEFLRRFIDEWLTRTQKSLVEGTGSSCRPDSVDADELYLQPCKVVLAALDYQTPQGLFQSPNAAFNKLATVLAYLVHELNDLVRQMEQDVFPQLLMFGEGMAAGGDASGLLEGSTQVALAKALPAFRRAALVIERLKTVTAALLAQLGASSAEHARKATILRGEAAVSGFWAVARACGVLARLDLLTGRNPALLSAFSMFQRLVQEVEGEAADFPPEAGDWGRALEGPLGTLRNCLAGREAFSGFLREHLWRGSEAVVACSAPSFLAAAAGFLRQHIGEAQERLSQGLERRDEREGLIGLLALGVVYARLCYPECPPDPKTLRLLVDIYTQAPLLPAFADVSMNPVGFLSAHLPSTADSYFGPALLRQVASARKTGIEALDEGAPAEARQLAHAVAAWEGLLDSIFDSPRSNEALLSKMGGAVLRGLTLAATGRGRLRLLLSLHGDTGAPLPRAALGALGLQLALLAGIRAAFRRHSRALASALPHLVTHFKSALAGQLSAVRAGAGAQLRAIQSNQPRFASTSARDKAALGLSEAMVAAAAGLDIAKGPASRAHMVGLALCLDALESTHQVPVGDLRNAREALRGLALLADLDTSLQQATSCSFLYFHRELLMPLVSQIWQSPEEAGKLEHVLAAFQDGHQLIRHMTTSRLEAHQAYDEEMLGVLREAMLEPLAAELEADLRQRAHALRQGSPPVKPLRSRKDYRALLVLPALPFLTRIFSIREVVKQRLSASFYNHAALSPVDTRAYADMASLAMSVYGLPVPAPLLRSTTLERGLDVLDVVRRMREFAGTYCYNLPSQLFVERAGAASGARQLNTLTSADVSAAIQAHGPILADVAATKAAVFLSHRLLILSQAMQGDAVRARLANEVRSVEEARDRAGGGKPYPVEAAEQLSGDLARLGIASDGGTYLDYFRRLISEMGNVLGFVRLMRHAVRHLSSAAAAPLADVSPEALMGFQSPGVPASLPSAEALSRLQALVRDLQQRSDGGVDYLTALVRVFAEQLNAPENANLHPFFVAVPALTLNAVEGALLAKEQLQRRGRGPPEPGFTHDGFALGIAFLLQVLGQAGQFGALQWFKAVQLYSKQEREKVLAAGAERERSGQAWSTGTLGRLAGVLSRGAAGSPDAPLGTGQQQALALELSRLSGFSAEFQLLHNTLTAALAFFSKP